MSFLALCSWNDMVMCVTDTLCVDAQGRDARLGTKAWTVPHLTGFITGTGYSDLPDELARTAVGHMICRNITEFVAMAPDILQGAYARIRTQMGATGGEPMTSSVWIAGWDPAAERFVTYELLSVDGFEPRQHSTDAGVVTKVLRPGGPGDPSVYDRFFDDPIADRGAGIVGDWMLQMSDLAQDIQAVHDELRADGHPEDTVEIGGEVMATVLSVSHVLGRPHPMMSTFPVATFPDYDRTWAEILRYWPERNISNARGGDARAAARRLGLHGPAPADELAPD